MVMVRMQFIHNMTNSQHFFIESQHIGASAVGPIEPTIANMLKIKLLLVVLALCWSLLANISRPTSKGFQIYLLAVGSLFVIKHRETV